MTMKKIFSFWWITGYFKYVRYFDSISWKEFHSRRLSEKYLFIKCKIVDECNLTASNSTFSSQRVFILILSTVINFNIIISPLFLSFFKVQNYKAALLCLWLSMMLKFVRLFFKNFKNKVLLNWYYNYDKNISSYIGYCELM